MIESWFSIFDGWSFLIELVCFLLNGFLYFSMFILFFDIFSKSYGFDFIFILEYCLLYWLILDAFHLLFRNIGNVHALLLVYQLVESLLMSC